MKYLLVFIALSCAALQAASKQFDVFSGSIEFKKFFETNIKPNGMPAIISFDRQFEAIYQDSAIIKSAQEAASNCRLTLYLNLSDAQREELEKDRENRSKSAASSAQSAAPVKK